MRIFSLILCYLLFLGGLRAQRNAQAWVQLSQLPQAESVASKIRSDMPTDYKAYQLDFGGLKSLLATAPKEFSEAAMNNDFVISLPMTDGSMEEFSIVETQLLPAHLYDKYPDTRTYIGRSLQYPGKNVRFSMTMHGLHAIVVHADRSYDYIEPMVEGSKAYYVVYARAHANTSTFQRQPYSYETPTGTDANYAPLYTPSTDSGVDGTPLVVERGPLDIVNLKVYKFACATTGEFSIMHGGTTASVLAWMTNYVNQLNAMYEYDLAIRMVFTDSIEKILFLDPNTDPYEGNNLSNWASVNPNAMGTLLGGAENYDIGHIFGHFPSGSAAQGLIQNGSFACTQGKGRAVSTGFWQNSTVGFGSEFVAVIGQEIGHQWRGGHTWNYCGPDNNQYTPLSAYEPGSASTIMGYAGLCGTSNVQNFTDLYYHSGSIDEIKTFYTQQEGASCGTLVPSGNNPPVVTLTYSNGFFIPKSTYFELNGSANDPDGDALTYCWEQMDLGPYTPLGQSNGSSPLFRTYPPTMVSNRVFPKVATIVANGTDVKEVIPNYSRDINMRLTVRDNRPGGGGVGTADVEFRVTDQAGPFLVTYPSALGTTFTSGTYKEITWDVANTDKSPVNAANVNIRLSTDGGLTFPTTLAANVPNDGSHCVLIPEITTTKGRIRIEAAANIFFDISNANFTIAAPAAADFSVCYGDDVEQICLPQVFSTSFSVAAVSGFSAPVSFSVVSGLPAGATANFSSATVMPGGSTNLTIDMTNVTVEGVHSVVVQGTATGGTTYTKTLKLTTVSNNFSSFALQTPTDGATGVGQAPTLTWSTATDANNYDVQIATSPSFENSILIATQTAITTGTWAVPTQLQKGTVYYWRVRPNNECSPHAWGGPFAFVTLSDACNTYSANDLPKNISGSSTPTVESVITVNAAGTISDVNIKKVGIYHDFFKDLTISVLNPAGAEVILVDKKCGNSSGTFSFGFDDQAPLTFACPPSQSGVAYKAEGSLATNNGSNGLGAWKLRVKDGVVGSGGTLSMFEIEICGSVTASEINIINNNIMQVMPGNNKAITSDFLKSASTAAGVSDGQLVYTLVTLPIYGDLRRNGVVLHAGDQFTQQELNDSAIRYYDYNTSHVGNDQFRFTVIDGQGGFRGTPAFQIQQFPVGTDEAHLIAFTLSPNPTSGDTYLRLPEAANADMTVQVYNMSGQLMRQSNLPSGEMEHTIHSEGLAKGMYVIAIHSARGVGYRKFVKD